MMKSRWSSKGSSLVEFAVFLPLALALVFGVVELAYGLLDQHIVTKLTREGSNLISRYVTLQDAGTAMRSMATRPVDFDDGSRLIFSVLRKVGTEDAANYGEIILYQRYEFGDLDADSRLEIAGTGSFGAAPNFVAQNSLSNTGLQVVNLPAGLDLPLDGMLYVTEVFTEHPLITPFSRFGGDVPTQLYSIAYF